MSIKSAMTGMGVFGVIALYFGLILGYMAIPVVVVYVLWHFIHKLW